MSAIQFVNKHSHVTRLLAFTEYGGSFLVKSQQIYIRGTGSPHSSSYNPALWAVRLSIGLYNNVTTLLLACKLGSKTMATECGKKAKFERELHRVIQ